jgi:hypothetical protein
MQRQRDVQPVDGKALFQSFQQAGCGRWIAVIKPRGQFLDAAKPSLAVSFQASRSMSLTCVGLGRFRHCGGAISCSGTAKCECTKMRLLPIWTGGFPFLTKETPDVNGIFDFCSLFFFWFELDFYEHLLIIQLNPLAPSRYPLGVQ